MTEKIQTRRQMDPRIYYENSRYWYIIYHDKILDKQNFLRKDWS